MEKINVVLYRHGMEKNAKFSAQVIYCDKCSECDFYKSRQCLRIRDFLNLGCKYGTKENDSGCTPRAKKYPAFYHKYHDDEMYNKLSGASASCKRFAVVGDYLYFNFSLFGLHLLKENEQAAGKQIFCKSGRRYSFKEKELIGITNCLIPKEDVTLIF